MSSYEMPAARLKSMRRSWRVLAAGVFAGMAFVAAISVSVIVQGYIVGGLISLLFVVPIVVMVLAISGPETMHNRLAIREEGLVPLKRPFRSTRDVFVNLTDIVEFEESLWEGPEVLAFHFGIKDVSGSRYSVNSMVLERYDKRAASFDTVLEAMRALRGRWEALRAARGTTGSPP